MIKDRKIKIVGIILIVLGTLSITLSPYTLYFYYLPLIVLVIGIILIWLTNSKIINKISLTLSPILFYSIFTYLWTLYNTLPPEIFLIPKDYRGKVNILYKSNCGESLMEIEDKLVYNIPNDGILILRNEQEFGFINQEYYLIDKSGKKTKLPKMDVRDFNEEWTLEKNLNEPSRNQLGVFHWGRTGTYGETIDTNGKKVDNYKECTFQEFYISTYNDLTKKFEFKYEQKFDTIRDEKLKKYC
ncbi:DUF6843 domain-containing protein, partial [Flavobacterium sp. ACAM 123]|uniref:DUF6843 domain-containing protein n=1 Tax=Flavobacterium sp. ACAM 123 TaxID=1189620 RepID=UPI000557ADE2